MISNEQPERLGPGPAAYDHLKSLKKMVVTKGREGPVFRAPSDLNEKVKQKLNVSSSEDLLKLKLLRAGPGSYDPDNSCMSNRGNPIGEVSPS